MKTYIFAGCITFALSFISCLILIPVLRKWKAGQNILSYVKEHKSKSGTPTMGGLSFILPCILISTFYAGLTDRSFTITLATGTAYMLIGFLDDFLKCKRKRNLGLTAWQKTVFMLAIACIVATYAYKSGNTGMHLPFTKRVIWFGWWTIPFVVFVFIATVNAVNLTDGLDGLAAGVSVPYFLTIGIIIFLQDKSGGYGTLCFCLVGSLLAYLLFNGYPASVFMGDTGSLALGGFATCIAVFTGNALYIPLLGVAFVFSVISVIIQVIYYKVTGGKRVFLMSPVHHHFQQKGFSESKIAYAYSVLTALIGAVCICGIL